jgi:hypothetical protein
MNYKIVLKTGKVVVLRDICAVDYFAGHLYFSDGEATYTFLVDEIVSSENIGAN